MSKVGQRFHSTFSQMILCLGYKRRRKAVEGHAYQWVFDDVFSLRANYIKRRNSENDTFFFISIMQILSIILRL